MRYDSKLRYDQPGTIRNNFYKNKDFLDFNEAYFEHLVFQEHRRMKYHSRNSLKKNENN